MSNGSSGHGGGNEGPGGGDGHGHDDNLVKIIFNGTSTAEPKGEYTFDQIVAIAKKVIPDLPSGPNILYTITYRKADGQKSEGSLVEGGKVKIKEGTIFNVTPTDKS